MGKAAIRAHLEKGLLSLCLNRFRNTTETPPEDWEIAAFRRALKVFVLKWKRFDRAVQIVTEEHFSGMRVLFDDTTAMLEKDNEDAQRLCDLFNAANRTGFLCRAHLAGRNRGVSASLHAIGSRENHVPCAR